MPKKIIEMMPAKTPNSKFSDTNVETKNAKLKETIKDSQRKANGELKEAPCSGHRAPRGALRTYACLCMYTCMHTCACIHMHEYTCMHTHACIHMHACKYVYICMHTGVCVDMHAYLCMHTHAWIHMHEYIACIHLHAVACASWPCFPLAVL